MYYNNREFFFTIQDSVLIFSEYSASKHSKFLHYFSSILDSI